MLRSRFLVGACTLALSGTAFAAKPLFVAETQPGASALSAAKSLSVERGASSVRLMRANAAAVAKNTGELELDLGPHRVTAVLDRATLRLQQEAERAGKGALFQRLRGFLFESPDTDDYRQIAKELGLRANTLAVTVHRLRERLRALVRTELANTVSSDVALNEELRAMRKALGRH